MIRLLYFARLVDTHTVLNYRVSKIPDGEFTRPPYLEKTRGIREANPKRFLKLFEENLYPDDKVGKILLFEVEGRVSKFVTQEGYVCLFDKNTTRLIQQRRETPVLGVG